MKKLAKGDAPDLEDVAEASDSGAEEEEEDEDDAQTTLAKDKFIKEVCRDPLVFQDRQLIYVALAEEAKGQSGGEQGESAGFETEEVKSCVRSYPLVPSSPYPLCSTRPATISPDDDSRQAFTSNGKRPVRQPRAPHRARSLRKSGRLLVSLSTVSSSL